MDFIIHHSVVRMIKSFESNFFVCFSGLTVLINVKMIEMANQIKNMILQF